MLATVTKKYHKMPKFQNFAKKYPKNINATMLVFKKRTKEFRPGPVQLFGPYLEIFRAIESHLEPFEAIWSHLVPIRRHLELF